jgi:ribose transport system permease protein
MRPGSTLSHLLSEYGMVGVLVLLCVYYSWVTYSEQHPSGSAGGQELAREVLNQTSAGARVLLVVGDNPQDAEFCEAAAAALRRSDRVVVAAVRGQPADARRVLEKLAGEGGGLAVIGCNQVTASWSVFENLGSRFPALAGARLVRPATYRWPNFLKADNLLNVANQIAVIAVIAIGMTVVIITGGIDLSVGSLIALSAVLAALVIRDAAGAEQASNWGMALACAAAVLVCGLVGLFSGLMITGFTIPAFIATLATMLVASGLAFILAKGQSIYQVPDSFTWLGRGATCGLPNAVWLMVGLYALGHLLMTRTVLGRYLYAVGGNAEAARLSGVPVKRVLLFAYTLCGALAGLGGVVMASQLKSGAPTYGQMYELYVIAAVVVGGASLSGGEGKVLGTLVGALIIAVIQNGMNLTGVESYTQKVVLGLVILGAVLLDMLKKGRWIKMRFARLVCVFVVAGAALPAAAAKEPALAPVVEAEEDVYAFEPANNGSGPMWCSGSTCLVRAGDSVFASGLETLKDAKPLNNCRWLLFARGPNGWTRVQADPVDRTREPSPLAGFPDGRLFLSVNPTCVTNRETYSGPARPGVLELAARKPAAPWLALAPVWAGSPKFTEHSYRSFAADGPRRELILFQNIDYTHAEWTFLDRRGKWSAQGQLKWPWGAEYDKPEPVRICYPNVMLKDRAVYFCGVSDVVEPYAKWRAFKKQLTGQEWDYDFRRLFFTWTPDIRTGKFQDWLELASRDRTCGWISPGDLWVAGDGTVHILWTERALDPRLREKFFADEKQSHSLNYAVVRKGKLVSRRALVVAEEGKANEVPSSGRFQVAPGGRLFVFYYVSGSNAAGKALSENRIVELLPGGGSGAPVAVPLQHPFGGCFTASVRAGSPPSKTLELLGPRVGVSGTMSYARIRLW